MAGGRAVATLLWEWTSRPGLERFELHSDPPGSILHGTILTLGARGPAVVEYTIRCDSLWGTRGAEIRLRDDRGERSIRIRRKRHGWFEGGKRLEGLEDCTDIDLGWTPSTNTVAIRRLKLPVGARSGPVTAAWVRFPELTLEPLEQEYERLGKHRYRYTSRRGAFRADLKVDRRGLVVDYQGFWRRVAGKP